jgi:hypothetical protein
MGYNFAMRSNSSILDFPPDTPQESTSSLFPIQVTYSSKCIINPFQIRRSQSVFGDGLFYKKTAAFLAGSSTPIGSLHYASWDDNVNQTPFSIVTDKETHSIVVSIRGSASFNDFVTDADFSDDHLCNIVKSMDLGEKKVESMDLREKEVESMDLGENDDGKSMSIGEKEVESIEGNDQQSLTRVASPNGETRMMDNQDHHFRVHGGMFIAAMIMLGFVQRVVADLKRNPNYANYQLVVTGHSLGAGVASLLTLMLKFILLFFHKKPQ